MTIILKEMIDKETGCELHKSDDGFYVIVYAGAGNSGVKRYSDMNEHGLLAAIETYQLELSYLWTAKHDEQENLQ